MKRYLVSVPREKRRESPLFLSVSLSPSLSSVCLLSLATDFHTDESMNEEEEGEEEEKGSERDPAVSVAISADSFSFATF